MCEVGLDEEGNYTDDNVTEERRIVTNKIRENMTDGDM